MQAPAGSNIVVRASASAGVTTEVEGGLQAPKTDEATLQKVAAKPDEKVAVTLDPTNPKRDSIRVLPASPAAQQSAL